MSEAKHTEGPYHWRFYANEPEDVERARKLGIEPVRMLTNEGQIVLMAGSGDDVKRVALIECQTPFKRGQGHKTECAERDATANLFAAAADLLAACKHALTIAMEYDDTGFAGTVVLKKMLREALAKATGAAT